MNSFFGNTEEDACINSLVEILHDGLVRADLLARRPNFAKWRRDFQTATEQGLVSQTDLEVTLVWYLNNIHKPFMPQAYSPTGFLDKYPAIRKRFLEARIENVAPVSKTRTREATTAIGLVPPPEGASDELLSWYDTLVEEGESSPGEISRYAEECELRSMTNR